MFERFEWKIKKNYVPIFHVMSSPFSFLNFFAFFSKDEEFCLNYYEHPSHFFVFSFYLFFILVLLLFSFI